MRGKVRHIHHGADGARITPAYAGKSARRVVVENAAEGSPPRMRGKVMLRKADGAAVRITPAYAGKSSREEFLAIPSEDHPRVCGEKQETEHP